MRLRPFDRLRVTVLCQAEPVEAQSKIKIEYKPGTMNIKKSIPLLLLLLPYLVHAQTVNLQKIFGDAERQAQVMLKEIPGAKGDKADLVSPRIVENGSLKLVTSRDWTSGFRSSSPRRTKLTSRAASSS